ncbi:hypothetical protein [Clostridium sp. KNHs205]|uniref:hypothetical protein n=1 Tax=Clostridium sp. KNHs205 TaxID=1449050 RepID=UPI00068A8A4E|nr:hypothetical protein [Clostridium sp. KNHs205]
MENKNQALLFDRIQENYNAFTTEWSGLSPVELIGKAEEIYAVRMTKEHLMGRVDEQQAAWLLRFENPLEIVRDRWIAENGMKMVHDEDFSHVLWAVMDSQDTEKLYALSKGAEPSTNRDRPVTVREFIEKHQGVAYDMMTPGGYVYLTPEKAQLLLVGQSTKGHPGSPEYAVEISAEELLEQEVVNARFSDGAWHLLSDYIHEMDMEQEQTPMEGVTLC